MYSLRGGDMRLLQATLRHESMSTTEKYVRAVRTAVAAPDDLLGDVVSARVGRRRARP